MDFNIDLRLWFYWLRVAEDGCGREIKDVWELLSDYHVACPGRGEMGARGGVGGKAGLREREFP